MTNTTITATITADETTEESNVVAAMSPAQTEASARKFAQAWDSSAAAVYNASVQARMLKESGLKGPEIVDILRAAIAERQATEMMVTDNVAIADIAASVKISTAAVSQLATALTRAESTGVVAANNKPLVKALYTAAVSGVKSADLKDIVEFAATLDTGKAEFALGAIAEQRAMAGKAKREAIAAKKAQADNTATGAGNTTSDDENAAKAPTRNGAALFTIADMLRAAAMIAKDTGDTSISAAAMSIAEYLAN